MGWWGSSSNGDGSSQNDAIGKLDPSLREFLDKESTVEYTPKPPSPTPKEPILSAPPDPIPSPPKTEESKPKVPRESLFPDGRYAHLWKNYEPLSSIEARGKSDQERLSDVVEAYNDRRASVGRVASENCALEVLAVQDCYKSGSYMKKMMLCRDENRAQNRCLEMQAKFLKALGYLNMNNRSPADDEKIQMHADKLYRQMLQQEKMIEQAKKEGLPVPEFQSVISKENLSAAMKGNPLESKEIFLESSGADVPEDTWKGVPAKTRKNYEKSIEKLSPIEREIEKKALEGEIAATRAYSKNVEGAFVEERIHRLKRKEEGKATIGDTIKTWWGW
ncbi:uncharacterized protein BDZ99DRAFT_459156 [Mytilinidion resinicola]|uniref:Autophagy protein n=1 Tax=Mytilinidion resinicola TaxID=574789 RepID=A0A6A6Z262_9PEZI|nr:uncharacterized protein BDZ99DRAFT_459156 [Mytilinidion resinicola]KAF2815226.1 hypothetical protein BDZ99DRAFT_459156 [Mytilinidion resinicola]